jgi:hypothetical protein
MPRGVLAPLAPLAMAAAIAVGFVGPYLVAPLGPAFAALAVAHMVCVLVFRAQVSRGFGLCARLAVLQPVGALFLVALFLRLAATMVAGGKAVVRWRSREYPG